MIVIRICETSGWGGRGRGYKLANVKSLKLVAEQLERFNKSTINFFLRLLLDTGAIKSEVCLPCIWELVLLL